MTSIIPALHFPVLVLIKLVLIIYYMYSIISSKQLKSKNKITTGEWGSKIYLIGLRSKQDVSIINCNIIQKQKDLTTNFTTQGFILTNFLIESHSKAQCSLSITSNNVIITLALNFKIAALLFSNYRGSNNMIKENSTAKCQKYVTQCGMTLFKSKM